MNLGHTHAQPQAGGPAADPAPPVRTMHDDVQSWTDSCSCEPEPRWQAVAEALEEQARAGSRASTTPDGGSGASDATRPLNDGSA